MFVRMSGQTARWNQALGLIFTDSSPLGQSYVQEIRHPDVCPASAFEFTLIVKYNNRCPDHRLLLRAAIKKGDLLCWNYSSSSLGLLIVPS